MVSICFANKNTFQCLLSLQFYFKKSNKNTAEERSLNFWCIAEEFRIKINWKQNKQQEIINNTWNEDWLDCINVHTYIHIYVYIYLKLSIFNSSLELDESWYAAMYLCISDWLAALPAQSVWLSENNIFNIICLN